MEQAVQVVREHGKSEDYVMVMKVLALIYTFTSLARIIILFMCTVYHKLYKLLLPLTLTIHIAHSFFYLKDVAKD